MAGKDMKKWRIIESYGQGTGQQNSEIERHYGEFVCFRNKRGAFKVESENMCHHGGRGALRA